MTCIEGDEHDRNATDRRPRDLAEADRHAARQGEGAHPRGDAIAEARWRLPMVEVDPTSAVVGAAGGVPLIDTFQEPVAAVCVGARRRVVLCAYLRHGS